MERFFGMFQEQLIDALRADCTELIKHIGAERLYAVALVTDSDAGTVYLGMNTEESLQRRVEYYNREMDGGYSSDHPTLRWMPDEWGYSDSDLGRSCLVEVSNMLLNREDYSDESRTAFYEAATRALQKLDEEGVFASIPRSSLTLFVSVTDDDEAEQVEDDSAKLLNPQEVYQQFAERFDGIEDAAE